MTSPFVVALVAIGALSIAPLARAQSDRDLQVPTAALAILEIPRDRGRALAMSRAIRVLHSAPRMDDALLPQMLELEQLLADLDRVESQASRAGSRGLNLDMARTSTERDGLKDALEVLGLRLRERRKVYAVEPDTSKGAVAVRARLRTVGIDTDVLSKRLNGGETIVIAPAVTPLPLSLTPDTWTSVVFERSIPPRALFGAIIRDRKASLLYHGVQAMTPATLAYLTKTPDLLRHFYRDAAGPVATFGGSFEIGADGRVVIPGGSEAVELWEALVDEPTVKPDRFGRALFSRDAGRLAYFFNTVAKLDEPHRRFALGLWIKDRGVRVDRFRELYHAFATVDDKWILADTPFARPSYDPATLLTVVAVTPQGSPAAPAFRKLWARAYDGDDLPDPDAQDVREPQEDGSIDAAWLAERITGILGPERRVRLERLAFGQRVFASVSESQVQDVLVALRGFARFPAAMLALERIGVHDPRLYGAMARHARVLERLEDPSQSVPLLAQFQGALAILERLARTGSVERDALERLVASLSALPVTGARYDGRLAHWLRTDLLPALPPPEGTAASHEDRLLMSLADRSNPAAPFQWEGDTYTFDVSSAWRTLKAVRAKQGGNTLDGILTAFEPVHALAHEPQTLSQVKALTATLGSSAAKLAAARPWPDAPDSMPESKKIIDRTLRDLGKISKPQDVSKAADEVEDVLGLLDYLLGETLVAIAYAPALGDPSALIGPTADVSHRHTFGVAAETGSSEIARRTAWRRSSVGSRAVDGDALTGSMLGVDLALARKQMRRIASNRLPGPPRLNGNDTATFVSTVALLNPRLLTDEQLRAIGSALTRGRERFAQAVADPTVRDGLAADAGLSDARRQLLAWASEHASDQIEGLFSVAEIFWLGTGILDDAHHDDLAPWGMSHESVTGCFCLRFPRPGSWDTLSGRQATSQLAASMPDVNLRVAGLLSDLQVPATLFPGIMAMAMQDYLDNVPAKYADDWEAFAAHAWQITRERVEDYVSALVASGPMKAASPETAR